MNQTQKLAVVSKVQSVIRRVLGDVGANAVHAALLEHFGIIAAEVSPPFTFEAPDIVEHYEFGQSVTSAAMSRECRRYGIRRDAETLAIYGYRPARAYVDGVRTRVWILPS